MFATFIAQYWLEVALTAIVGILGFFIKRYIKLEKDNRDRERAEFKSLLMQEIEQKKVEQDTQHARLQSDIDLLKKGVLSFQGRIFKDSCRAFLSADEISLEAFEDIEADHEVYNGLGGNHEGDILFNLSKKRVEQEIIKRHNNTNQ